MIFYEPRSPSRVGWTQQTTNFMSFTKFAWPAGVFFLIKNTAALFVCEISRSDLRVFNVYVTPRVNRKLTSVWRKDGKVLRRCCRASTSTLGRGQQSWKWCRKQPMTDVVFHPCKVTCSGYLSPCHPQIGSWCSYDCFSVVVSIKDTFCTYVYSVQRQAW